MSDFRGGGCPFMVSKKAENPCGLGWVKGRKAGARLHPSILLTPPLTGSVVHDDQETWEARCNPDLDSCLSSLLFVSSHTQQNTITQTLVIMYAKTAAVLALALGLASAAPTATPASDPSKTVPLTGVTHSVVAGLGGLHFDPDNVVAEIGDVVEWHFLPKNHSVVQSSFDKPCQPLSDTSFFGGFYPTADGQNPDVFQIVVKDKSPIWYYCSQTNGNHCQNGMGGVINQNFDSDKTLARYKEIAAGTGTSVSPPTIQGGQRIPNPNPNGGF
ncbi:hypothetical protein VTK73DRAFT_2350 [Phialemonium thermophilum]|uniref:Extracellular serine-rich protein n=1 Tax=Phialemonium thermophilum TaxID=223376 RepID=A0ABR3VS97_9PEZI